MKRKQTKVDSELLLNAARENDYSQPACETQVSGSKPVAGSVDDKAVEHEDVVGIPDISEAPAPVVPKEVQRPVLSEKPRRERGRRMSHKDIFVRNTSLKARKGRQAYMREEFYEQIQKIVEVVGNRQVTVASYLDNVLAYHFEMFSAEITAELNEGFSSSYNSNIRFEF